MNICRLLFQEQFCLVEIFSIFVGLLNGLIWLRFSYQDYRLGLEVFNFFFFFFLKFGSVLTYLSNFFKSDLAIYYFSSLV